MKNHLIDSHIKDAKVLKCSKCEFKTKDKEYLRLHQFRHGKNFECQKCDKKFATYTVLMRHLKIHDKKNRYRCDHCSHLTVSKYNLVKHIFGQHKSPCVCQKCGLKFRSRFDLKNHETLHFEYANRYQCDHCSHSTVKKHNLLYHMFGQHKSPCVCQNCGLKFPSRFDLKNHETIHSKHGKTKNKFVDVANKSKNTKRCVVKLKKMTVSKAVMKQYSAMFGK
jgi:KRAB domain-containing zinc finger protein